MIEKDVHIDESTKTKFGGFIGDLPSLTYCTDYVEHIVFKSEDNDDLVSIPNPMILEDVVIVDDFNFEKWPSVMEPASSLYFSINMKRLISEVNARILDIKESLRDNDK